MERVFETHAHYLFAVPIGETIRIFRDELKETGAEKVNFLSIPKEYNSDGSVKLDLTQNVKGLYLKRAFSPNGYAMAGLVHPDDHSDTDAVSKEFLRQIETYRAAGFDGMKMLEGYPTFIKYTGIPLDSPVFDRFYSFAEENAVPITMHIANPDDNWDITKASRYAIAAGRVYDNSFPSKKEITEQAFRALDKHPKLRLTLAHFGFFSRDITQAERFLGQYENTMLDITPGGEQLLYMGKEWEKWLPFFERCSDRILYGTDFYAFPRRDEESWRTAFTRRPFFVRNFFETAGEHLYLETPFRGVLLDRALREKIYWDNAMHFFGEPRPVSEAYLRDECGRLAGFVTDALQLADLETMRNGLGG